MEIEKMLTRLLKGEDVKKIVNERLEYLRSEEYQNSKCHIISNYSGKNDLGTLVKWQGFIPEDFIIDSNNALGNYFTSETNIYEEYLLYLKHLLETNQISFEKAIKAKPFLYVQNYFTKECDSEYKKIIDEMREANWSENNIREWVRTYIYGYKENKDKFNNFEKYVEYFDKIESLIEEGKIEKTDPIVRKYNYIMLNSVISIEDLKGLGVGPAQCSEFATCFQNLSSFLGIDTYNLCGMLSINGKSEGHNFNVINEKGKWKVVDTAGNNYFELDTDFDIDSFINGDYEITHNNVKYSSINNNTYIDISSPKGKKIK